MCSQSILIEKDFLVEQLDLCICEINGSLLVFSFHRIRLKSFLTDYQLKATAVLILLLGHSLIVMSGAHSDVDIRSIVFR